MHPKPSELGSQAGVGQPSTAEGDHAGTFGVVSFLLVFAQISMEGGHMNTLDEFIMFEFH
jgi:hypothetical protein